MKILVVDDQQDSTRKIIRALHQNESEVKMMEIKAMKELAKAILKAQALHEKSWDGEQYTLTHEQAANASIKDPFVSRLITMLNYSLWNDIQDWANKVLEIKDNVKTCNL